MSLNVTHETVHCDGDQCENSAPIANSVIKGWWFTVYTDKEPGTTGRYVDYCPDCSGGKTIHITPPEPENKP